LTGGFHCFRHALTRSISPEVGGFFVLLGQRPLGEVFLDGLGDRCGVVAHGSAKPDARDQALLGEVVEVSGRDAELLRLVAHGDEFYGLCLHIKVRRVRFLVCPQNPDTY
jgi:hypothetical protein